MRWILCICVPGSSQTSHNLRKRTELKFESSGTFFSGYKTHVYPICQNLTSCVPINVCTNGIFRGNSTHLPNQTDSRRARAPLSLIHRNSRSKPALPLVHPFPHPTPSHTSSIPLSQRAHVGLSLSATTQSHPLRSGPRAPTIIPDCITSA